MRQLLLKFYFNYLTIILSNSVHINNTINKRYNLLNYYNLLYLYINAFNDNSNSHIGKNNI